MSCTSQNFRLFHVSNLSVRNFRIFLLMYTGPHCQGIDRLTPRRSRAVPGRPGAALAPTFHRDSRKPSVGFTGFSLFSLRLLRKYFTTQFQSVMESWRAKTQHTVRNGVLARQNTAHCAEFAAPRAELWHIQSGGSREREWCSDFILKFYLYLENIYIRHCSYAAVRCWRPQVLAP